MAVKMSDDNKDYGDDGSENYSDVDKDHGDKWQ